MRRPAFHNELTQSWLAPHKSNVRITRWEIHLSFLIRWPAGKHWEPNNAGAHRHASLPSSSSETFQRFVPIVRTVCPTFSPCATALLSFYFDSPFCLSCSMKEWQCSVSCQLLLCYYLHSLRASAIDLSRSLLSLQKLTSSMLETFWLSPVPHVCSTCWHTAAHYYARRCVGNGPPWR